MKRPSLSIQKSFYLRHQARRVFISSLLILFLYGLTIAVSQIDWQNHLLLVSSRVLPTLPQSSYWARLQLRQPHSDKEGISLSLQKDITALGPSSIEDIAHAVALYQPELNQAYLVTSSTREATLYIDQHHAYFSINEDTLFVRSNGEVYECQPCRVATHADFRLDPGNTTAINKLPWPELINLHKKLGSKGFDISVMNWSQHRGVSLVSKHTQHEKLITIGFPPFKHKVERLVRLKQLDSKRFNHSKNIELDFPSKIVLKKS